MILICKQCSKPFNTTITRTTKYCGNKCYGIAITGSTNQNWKGGRRYAIDGHIYIKVSQNHPHKNSTGYIFEHRYVMEQKLGRYLLPTELVHHLNGIKDDNRIENLVIITKAQHNTAHFKGKPSHNLGKHWKQKR